MRALILLGLAAAASALELGAPAPPLTGADWVVGEAPALGDGVPAAIVLSASWCAAPREQLDRLAALGRAHEDHLRVALLCRDEHDAVAALAPRPEDVDARLACVPPALVDAWLGDAPGLPQAVLVDGDGAVAWCGHPLGLEAAARALAAGSLDRAAARRLRELERALGEVAAADPPELDRALAITGDMLALDPLDPLAIDARLACADRLGRADLYRATLAGVPLDRLGAWQACDLARARLDDPAPARKHLDLAVAWAARARALAPREPRVCATWARALAAIGLVDDALAQAEQACALAPDDADARALAESLRDATTLRRVWAGRR